MCRAHCFSLAALLMGTTRVREMVRWSRCLPAVDAMLYLMGTIYGTEVQHEIAEMIEYDRDYAANLSALGIMKR